MHCCHGGLAGARLFHTVQTRNYHRSTVHRSIHTHSERMLEFV